MCVNWFELFTQVKDVAHGPLVKLYESDETKYVDLREMDYHFKSHVILQSLGRKSWMALRMKNNQCTWIFVKQNIHIYMSTVQALQCMFFCWFKFSLFTSFTSEEELFLSFLYKYDLGVEPVTP